jgi:hypothetical protein
MASDVNVGDRSIKARLDLIRYVKCKDVYCKQCGLSFFSFPKDETRFALISVIDFPVSLIRMDMQTQPPPLAAALKF